MTEDEKIEKIIDKYTDYLKNSNADVFHSTKGVWSLWEYDEEHHFCNSFVLFETAEELEEIIVGLIASDINFVLEVTAEEVQHSLNEIEINEAMLSCYDMCIPRLLENIEVLNHEFKKGAEKLDVVFRSLSGILDKLQK